MFAFVMQILQKITVEFASLIGNIQIKFQSSFPDFNKRPQRIFRNLFASPHK